MLSRRALNRATLARQMLLAREAVPVTDTVRRLLGLQAQTAASAYLSLWNRVFDPAGLDQAFADRTVVRATLLRITLHAVAADDHPMLQNAVLRILRAARLGDRRFTVSGLTAADADEFLPVLLAFTATSRSAAEIDRMITEHFGGERRGLWWALRTCAPLLRTPTGGPWSFGREDTFLTAPELLPVERRDASTRELVHRYLTAYGPASIADMGQFTLLPARILREAVRSLADQLVELTAFDGTRLYDVLDGLLPDEETPAPPRLLGMWDNVLLAHADRTRFTTAEHRKMFARMNGDLLPTVLVDGRVAGIWRIVPSGVEVSAFHPIGAADWSGLAAEAAGLVEFLAERDPAVYRRHAHWWDKPLPVAETRILP
ncbi:winged helix DNA-binding domain-containing protein [Actinoplanes regularis]|uniref:Winged helix DNA-binding domain-containing protein n=1 Tax=Actinoplanes regularis TaxID=52697 RepID=A0A238WH43_9ACTN|nr:winged helix DNA-binding domain-containing protein [Actinoplanes regularis]GIE84907.1 hypothetical protein Are01nite_13870 [Actinoplanes regularis]SNR45651.1 Winged helix DNA-binding domain-containing protein [Actinoplanes regularis]